MTSLQKVLDIRNPCQDFLQAYLKSVFVIGDVSMTIAVVVDNNPQELQQTVSQLKKSGAFTEINPFEDSVEAAKYIELHDCDVVFTEVEMNGVSGFDFIRRFESHHPGICLVFVTNKSNYALQAFEYGTADFIMKPVDMKSIKRVMKNLQKRWHTNITVIHDIPS